jgi:hypothetical protein
LPPPYRCCCCCCCCCCWGCNIIIDISWSAHRLLAIQQQLQHPPLTALAAAVATSTAATLLPYARLVRWRPVARIKVVIVIIIIIFIAPALKPHVLRLLPAAAACTATLLLLLPLPQCLLQPAVQLSKQLFNVCVAVRAASHLAPCMNTLQHAHM